MSFPIRSSSGSNDIQLTEVTTVDSIRREIDTQAHYSNQISSDLNSTQESVGGMMRIVPSEVDVSVFFLKDDVSVNMKHVIMLLSVQQIIIFQLCIFLSADNLPF